MRLAPALPGRPPTRFGLTASEITELLARHLPAQDRAPLELAGIHFHLDGYDAGERRAALAESVRLIDTLRGHGPDPAFVDIGGGIPMSYLPDAGQWEAFWDEHRAALLGDRDPLTYDGHGLGLTAHAGEIIGQPKVYPYHQALVRGDWLDTVLDGGVADALRARALQLRCEPGRSLLDGCGLTAARVEFRKQRADGTWLIGLAMNRTQCRSTSEDHLVDPLLVRPTPTPAGGRSRATGPIEGYLVGAYCIERELLTWRRLQFPDGVRVGDIIVFPNTAGYLMHILESASHQIPLARNLVVGASAAPFQDPIDVTEQ